MSPEDAVKILEEPKPHRLGATESEQCAIHVCLRITKAFLELQALYPKDTKFLCPDCGSYRMGEGFKARIAALKKPPKDPEPEWKGKLRELREWADHRSSLKMVYLSDVDLIEKIDRMLEEI